MTTTNYIDEGKNGYHWLNPVLAPELLTKNIVRGATLLRSMPEPLDSPAPSSEPLLIAALHLADQFAETQTTDEAIAIAKSDPQRRKAFLSVADRLHVEDAYKLPEFAIRSTLELNPIAQAGVWLQAELRSSKGVK